MNATKITVLLSILSVVLAAAVSVVYVLHRNDVDDNAARERYQICKVQQDTIAVLEANLAGGSRIFVKILPPDDPDLIEAAGEIARRITQLRKSQKRLECPAKLIAPLGPPSPIGKDKNGSKQSLFVRRSEVQRIIREARARAPVATVPPRVVTRTIIKECPSRPAPVAPAPVAPPPAPVQPPKPPTPPGLPGLPPGLGGPQPGPPMIPPGLGQLPPRR